MFRLFKKNKNSIVAPVQGKIIPLSDVSDEVFASGMMGKGIAIEPNDGVFVAPADGTIVLIAKTKHAFGLRLDCGIELLVHIGLDTVTCNGQGFEILKKEGDVVKSGTPIIKADLTYFKEKKMNTQTPIILLNEKEYDIKLTKAMYESCIAGVTKLMEYTSTGL